jgi:fermentation-respiration switch protein FrsA (DUF1100 family)
MLFMAHRIIVAVYVLLPALALGAAGWEAWRRRRMTPLTSLGLTFGAGFAIGLALALVYGVGTSGRLITEQVLKAGYFATGLLLVLKGFDALLRATLLRIAGLRETAIDDPTLPDPPLHPVHVPSRRWMRFAFVGVARAAILFAIGLPYVMVAVLTYRVKVAPIDDPQSQLGYAFERVTFEATDSVPLVGWWIPAQRPRRGAKDEHWGRRTVVVCHGLAANKSNQLILARQYPDEGFNVLIFDFRAHGESGGQLATFGDRERRDVLGAVRYLRTQRADESEKIFGVGASLGAAALIAAAADPSDDGRAIEAVAVYGTFDSLPALTRTIGQRYFFPPLRQLLIHLGLPLANVQTGAHLSGFAPAELAPRLWPRPILIIHGRRDEIIQFEHGESLYDAAAQPKYHFYLKDGTHNAIVDNASAAKVAAEFFKSAEPVPVI